MPWLGMHANGKRSFLGVIEQAGGDAVQHHVGRSRFQATCTLPLHSLSGALTNAFPG